MDPGPGQDETFYYYPGTNPAVYLASEVVPYIVIPKGSFADETGVNYGEVVVVIYAGKIAAAVVGDRGPLLKIGEGSIRLHEALHPPAPDPCSLRDGNGYCKRVLNSSIEQDVLYFIFPNTAAKGGLNQSNIELFAKQTAYARFAKLRNTVVT
jgi:hypothetical protein